MSKFAQPPLGPQAPPLYTLDDVDRLATRIAGVPYGVPFRPHPQVEVEFAAAGHIVGAAFATIRLRDGGRTRCLLVSGDLGEASPLLVSDRAPPPPQADVVVIKSTYGDRDHRPLAETENELIEVLDDVLHRRRGNVIAPAFALGRTQELLVLLYRLVRAGRVRVPLVFVDSPLASRAAEVTFAHLDALDEEAATFHAAQRAGKLPFALRYTESVEDSMFLNSIRAGSVIIAASGMCEAGRTRSAGSARSAAARKRCSSCTASRWRRMRSLPGSCASSSGRRRWPRRRAATKRDAAARWWARMAASCAGACAAIGYARAAASAHGRSSDWRARRVHSRRTSHVDDPVLRR